MQISILHNQQEFTYSIPFIDDASIKNSLICLTTLISLNIDYKQLKTNLVNFYQLKCVWKLKKRLIIQF